MAFRVVSCSEEPVKLNEISRLRPMVRFPERETDVMALAQNIITGLTGNPATYPAPRT